MFTFRYSDLRSLTSFIIDIHDVGGYIYSGVEGSTALAGMTVCTGVGKRLHTLPSHPMLAEPQGVQPEER